MLLRKIGIISSGGGHLFQLLRIKHLLDKFPSFWVITGKSTKNLFKKEKIYFAYYPESRNWLNMIKNFILAIKILQKEKPQVLISIGAGVTVPFFIAGKYLLKTKLIFIEPFDFIAYPSLTGRIVYNFVDLFIVQHKIQKKWYPKAKYWGSLL